jgi:predicted acyl esterase|tara:strand:- start:723 stop:1106 length:384 start_codon:yes stop_codon:yes gene_type:complete
MEKSMTTLKEDISKAYFDSKDLQETINKTILTDRHNEVYSFKEIFRKHEGTTVEGDLIGDVADDLVETMDRISGRIDEIISIVDDLKDWHDRVDKDQLGQGADIIEDIITSFDLFVNASKKENNDEK